MTLAPGRVLGPRLQLVQDADVLVHEELGEWCYAPGCGNRPEPGAHHIEPRSRTAGPKRFVVIDGVVVPNLARLCTKHHNQVTGGIGGHTARIVYHMEPIPHWCWLERALDTGTRPVLECPSPEWAAIGPLRFPHHPEVCDGRTPAL